MNKEEFFKMFDEAITNEKAKLERLTSLLSLYREGDPNYTRTKLNQAISAKKIKRLEELVAVPAYNRITNASSAELQAYKDEKMNPLLGTLNLLEKDLTNFKYNLEVIINRMSEVKTTFFDNGLSEEKKKNYAVEYFILDEQREKLENDIRDHRFVIFHTTKELNQYQNLTLTEIKKMLCNTIVNKYGETFLNYVSTGALSEDEKALADLSLQPEKVIELEVLANEYKNLEQESPLIKLEAGCTLNEKGNLIVANERLVSKNQLKEEKFKIGVFLNNELADIIENSECNFTEMSKIRKSFDQYQVSFKEGYQKEFFANFKETIEKYDMNLLSIEHINSMIITAEKKLVKRNSEIKHYKRILEQRQVDLYCRLLTIYRNKLTTVRQLDVIEGIDEDFIEEMSEEFILSIPKKLEGLAADLKDRIALLDEKIKSAEEIHEAKRKEIIKEVNKIIGKDKQIFNEKTFENLVLSSETSITDEIINKRVDVEVAPVINKANTKAREDAMEAESGLDRLKEARELLRSDTKLAVTGELKEVDDINEEIERRYKEYLKEDGASSFVYRSEANRGVPDEIENETAMQIDIIEEIGLDDQGFKQKN